MGLTIRDIARIAGVSRSTVSLALNDSPRINPDTKKRVLEIVDKLDYHPNAMARALVEKRSRVFALVVPKIDGVFRDYYFAETVSGITDAIYDEGYSLMLQVASEAFIERNVHERLFKERRIDGMLIVGSLTTDIWIEQLREKGHPICLVNSLWDGVSSVVADNRAGAESVVDHLVSLGHRDIGYIKGLDITTVGIQRDEGFKAALAKHGLKYDEEMVAYGNFSETSGFEAMGEILKRKRRPSAIFAMNDRMAIGAMRAIRESGMSVPEDIAIVGADDIELAHYVTPTLTTIRQPMDEIGRLAVDKLLSALGRDPREDLPTGIKPFNHTLDTTLIVRESCGAGTKAANV